MLKGGFSSCDVFVGLRIGGFWLEARGGVASGQEGGKWVVARGGVTSERILEIGTLFMHAQKNSTLSQENCVR